MRFLLSVFMLVSSVPVSAAASEGDQLPAIEHVSAGGVDVAIRRADGPSPAVVFEAGAGDGLETWDPIFNAVSRFAGALAYSRPGRGGSGPSPLDDDGVRSVDEAVSHLKAVLDATDTKKPVILVGHSLGGLYVLNYAKQYPNEVAGIVLVDSRPADFRKECIERKISACAGAPQGNPAWPTAVQADFMGVTTAEAAAPQPQELGATPVTVISAGKSHGGPTGDVSRALWLELSEGFAARAENGRYVVDHEAGHYLHKENPALVIDEIRKMFETLSD